MLIFACIAGQVCLCIDWWYIKFGPENSLFVLYDITSNGPMGSYWLTGDFYTAGGIVEKSQSHYDWDQCSVTFSKR